MTFEQFLIIKLAHDTQELEAAGISLELIPILFLGLFILFIGLLSVLSPRKPSPRRGSGTLKYGTPPNHPHGTVGKKQNLIEFLENSNSFVPVFWHRPRGEWVEDPQELKKP